MKPPLVHTTHDKPVMQGMFYGSNQIYEIGVTLKPIPCLKVSFLELSEAEQMEALNLGFSPAISLPAKLPWGGYYEGLCGDTLVKV